MSRFTLLKRLALGAMALAAATTVGAYDSPAAGSVYTLSNAVTGNSILSFTRDAQGALTAGASYATGGQGSGGGLGNQGAIVSDGEFVFAVNAGSNDVSVFRIGRHGLRLVDRMASGGLRPVSIAVDRNLVYVLNAGSDSIAGFWLSQAGRLYALPGSERGLSGTGTAPAQIQFSSDGRTLIVTEKATNSIVTFSLGRNGVPTDMHVVTSATPTPFGFAVSRRNVIVSEAVGGAPNASALSSYRVRRTGELDVVSPAVATTQTAACWVVITPDGRFAYTTNTASGTVSSYRLRGNGELTLLAAVGGDTGAGSGPIDMALGDDGQFLHILNSGTHTIATFKVMNDGALQAVGAVGALPGSTNGLLAF